LIWGKKAGIGYNGYFNKLYGYFRKVWLLS
jgi:hypothetical protein